MLQKELAKRLKARYDTKMDGNPIRTSPPKKETAPDITEAEIIKDLTETEVQSNEPS